MCGDTAEGGQGESGALAGRVAWAAGDRRPARSARRARSRLGLCVCHGTPALRTPLVQHQHQLLHLRSVTLPPQPSSDVLSTPTTLVSLFIHRPSTHSCPVQPLQPGHPPPFLTYPRIPPRIHPRTETKHADDPRPDESLFAVAPRQRLRCPDAEQRGPPTTHPPSSRRKQVTKHRGRLRRQIVSVFNACPNFSHLNQQSNAQWLCGFADFMNRT